MEPITDSREAGRFLKQKIKEKGFLIKDVAERISADPSYMSHLLSGRVSVVDSEYFAPMVKLLGLTIEEVKALNPSAVITVAQPTESEPSAFDPRALFHPPAQRQREKRPLWPNLAVMIEEKQERYPQLRETRWQQHLNQTRFANGQDPDPDGWFEMYQAMRRNNVEPEAWPDED